MNLDDALIKCLHNYEVLRKNLNHSIHWQKLTQQEENLYFKMNMFIFIKVFLKSLLKAMYLYF